jgi:hypothetical protein
MLMASFLFRREGFTRIQTVFFVVVLLVLLGVAFSMVSNYVKLHSPEYALENARALNTLLAQYATDNDGAYPTGEGTRAQGKSEGIALNLLQNQFTPNADIFAAGSTPRYTGTDKDYADLAPENMSWDFTAGANATTGIKTDAPDSLPVLYTTGETVDYQPGKGVALSGNGPFGNHGMIVALKSGAATYQQASGNIAPAFVPADFKDSGTYTQIKP